MIAFFHGLESKPGSKKATWLEDTYGAYCPAMDYGQPGLFDKVLQEVKDKKVTILIGSSMGGWFAYCISTLTGIPTLLFNPAVHSRLINPSVRLGNKKANHTIVLGKKDDIIDPIQTVEWADENGVGKFQFFYENYGHRTPMNEFRKWVNKYSINESSKLMSFSQFLNIN